MSEDGGERLADDIGPITSARKDVHGCIAKNVPNMPAVDRYDASGKRCRHPLPAPGRSFGLILTSLLPGKFADRSLTNGFIDQFSEEMKVVGNGHGAVSVGIRR